MSNSEKRYLEYWRAITNSPEIKTINLRDVKLKIPFGVFNPSDEITYSSSFLIDNIPLDLSKKRILDMGTGSGVVAIKSELNNAKSVVAVDIHKKSVKTAIENSYENNCSNIAFIWSDLFDNLVGGQFDYIFANLSILEVDFEDIYGRLLNYYENFLTNSGELWIVFASFGDMNKVASKFLNHPNLNKDDIISINKLGVDWYIYKFKK